MKFQISRTSVYDSKISPCEEAFKDKYTYIDIRGTDDPSKIPAYQGKSTNWWYGDGENHRVENGQIMRDFPGREDWFININTLEELMELQKKYGQLVLENFYSNRQILSIEIYDDYRE